jgi:RimJ/RimL family protein N-acetyltransferase
VRLSSPEVTLRPGRDEDAGQLAAAFRADPAMGVALGVETDPDAAELRERFARPLDPAGAFLALVIADPVSDEPLGMLFLHGIDDQHRRGEVGFYLVPEARGRGLASAAVRLGIDWLIDARGAERVEMTTTPDNERVFALAARLGFTREGVLRARNLERGRRVDVVWFGLLAGERRW